ncbi:MAG: hypothetical protein ABIH46_02430 [Chloroflexota bacterium]
MREIVLVFDPSTARFFGKKIGTSHVANQAITSALMAPNALATPHIQNQGILSASLGSGQIGPHIAAAGVIATHLASGIVDWYKLAAASIRSGHLHGTLGYRPVIPEVIAPGAILSASLGAEVVGDSHIRSGVVDAAKLAGTLQDARLPNAFSEKFFSGTIRIWRPDHQDWLRIERMPGGTSAAPATILLVSGQVSLGYRIHDEVAGNLFTAASGNITVHQYVDGVDLDIHRHTGLAGHGQQIQSGGVAPGEIGTPHLVDLSVLSGKLGAPSVGNPHVLSGSIPHVKLGSIGANDHHIQFTSGMHSFPHPSSLIGSGAVLSGGVGSGQVGAPHLAPASVVSGHLGSGVIVSGLVASGQIGAPHIAPEAIVSGKIQSGLVNYHLWKLYSQAAVSNVNSVSFTGLPPKDMWMMMFESWLVSGASEGLGLRMNDDSGLNYHYRILDDSTISVVTDQGSMNVVELQTPAWPAMGMLMIQGRPRGTSYYHTVGLVPGCRETATMLLNGIWAANAIVSGIQLHLLYAASRLTGKFALHYMDW